MQLDEKLIQYWRACDIEAYKYKRDVAGACLIARTEINNGKIIPADKIKNLWEASSEELAERLVLVAPRCALDMDERLQGLVFFTAMLSRDGCLQAYKPQPLPWLAEKMIEPSWQRELTLASRAEAQRGYQFFPPPWLDESEELSWQQQLEYADYYFEQVVNIEWRYILTASGYHPISELAILPLNVEVNSRELIATGFQKAWHKVLELDIYEPGPIRAEITQVKANSFATKHSAHITNKFALTAEQRDCLIQALILDEKESLYITANVGTGKTLVWHDLLASIWVNSILDKTKPLLLASLTNINDYKLEKHSILDCIPVTERWLAMADIKLLTNLDRLEVLAKQKHFIAQSFIEKAADEFNKTISSLTEAKILLENRISLLSRNLEEKIVALTGEEKLENQFTLHYQQFGGINIRLAELKAQLEEQQANHRHLQVLQSLWNRQVDSIPKVVQVLGILLPGRRRRLGHLYSFFEQHLPAEDVKDLSIREMSQRINNLLLQSEKRQQILMDSYLQVESDLRQLEIARDRQQTCLQDSLAQTTTVVSGLEQLDQSLRYELFIAVAHYFEIMFLQAMDCDDDLIISKLHNYEHTIVVMLQEIYKQKVSIYTVPPLTEEFDYLVVENADLISPSLTKLCIENACKLLVMGSAFPLDRVSNTLSHQIDQQLLEHYLDIGSDDDLEDLDYLGLGVNNGSIGRIFSQVADYRGGKYALQLNFDIAPKLISCAADILNLPVNPSKLLVARDVVLELAELSHIAVKSPREEKNGSWQNMGEVVAIIDWLQAKQAEIVVAYPQQSLSETIAIYTPFAEQAEAIKEALDLKNLKINIVSCLEKLLVKRTEIVIFSSVYTVLDRGDLMFDSGANVLASLLLTAKKHLLVFGDPGILDPGLHSPSGKLAKHMLAKTEYSGV